MKYILIFIALAIFVACGGGGNEEAFEEDDGFQESSNALEKEGDEQENEDQELVIIKATSIPATATPIPKATATAAPLPKPTAKATQLPKPTATSQPSSKPEEKEIDSNMFASWSADGKHIVYVNMKSMGSNIFVMNSDGSSNKQLTFETNTMFREPSFSPDGSKILFAEGDMQGDDEGLYHIGIMNLDGSNITQLTDYSKPNNSSSNYYQRFSSDGSKITFTSYSYDDENEDYDIYMMNSDGSNLIHLSKDDLYGYVTHGSLSPNNTKFIYSALVVDPAVGIDIFVMNIDGSHKTRLTHDGEMATNPVWSSDGSKISYLSTYGIDDNINIWIMNADGTDQENHTLYLKGDVNVQSWAPDDKYIIFDYSNGKDFELYIMNTEIASVSGEYITKFTDGNPQAFTSTKSQPIFDSNWGKIIAYEPQVFSTFDISQTTIDLTTKWYKIASDAWGNYGPVELYIVGNDMDAAKKMEDEFCDRHKILDPKWKVEWDCANENHEIFTRYITDGGAAVSSYRRDYIDYHFMTVTMSSKYPGPEEDDYKPVTLHEYFHVYQHAHISDLEINGDKSGRTSKQGGAGKPWFAEGSAEFMAQLLYSKQPGITQNYLKDKMEYKYISVDNYLSYGKRLEDLSYTDPVATYDIGSWFIAYLVNKFGEQTLRVDFYKDLDSLGFEGSFKKHFLKSSKELVDEFDVFIAGGKDKALEIIP